MSGVNCCGKCRGPCLAQIIEKEQQNMGKNSSRRARILEAAKKAANKTLQPQPEPVVTTTPVEEERSNVLLLPDKGKTHVVQIFRDSQTEYPQLYMDVFITQPFSEILMAEMFAKAACRKAKSIDEADLVVFTGGPDVAGPLYGVKKEDCHTTCNFNKERDDSDMKFYAEALKKRVPMLGICRGAQFLHAMNNGVIYQHVDGHRGDHPVTTFDNLMFTVSSTHHQMCMKNDRMEVLAVAHKSKERWLNKRESEVGNNHDDVEAFFYPATACLGFQGHPEYHGVQTFTKWVMTMIQDKIKHSPSIQTEGRFYRLKQNVIIK